MIHSYDYYYEITIELFAELQNLIQNSPQTSSNDAGNVTPSTQELMFILRLDNFIANIIYRNGEFNYRHLVSYINFLIIENQLIVDGYFEVPYSKYIKIIYAELRAKGEPIFDNLVAAKKK